MTRARILLIGLAIGCAGCAPAIKQSQVMREQGASGMTPAELELRVQDFTLRYGGLIEETAHRILAEQPEPLVRLAVLRWRLHAVLAFQKPLFQSDPFVAVVDAWLLAEQMILYYQEGAGRGTLGAHEAAVVETCVQLRQELGALFVRGVGGTSSRDIDQARADEWVRAHPLRSDFFVRESLAPAAARTLASRGTSIAGALVTASSALTTANTRVTLLVEMIPKLVAWQVELAAVEALVDPETGRMALEHVVPVTALLDDIQAGADRQMQTAFENVDQQRLATLAGVKAERIAVLDGVGAERQAIFADVARERQALLDTIEDERTQILEAVHQEIAAAAAHVTEERKATLAQVNAMTEARLRDADAMSAALVDRLFWRLLALVGAAFVVALVYRVVAARVAGGRSTSA